MAEAIVSAIDKLATFATRHIKGGIELHTGISIELGFIKNELENIRAFLNDTEDRMEESDGVKAWVRQVRNVAYRIEDVLDEHFLSIRDEPTNRCLRIPYKVCLCFTELMPRQNITSSITEIKAEISEIQRRKLLYNLQISGRGGSDMDMVGLTSIRHDPRMGFLYHDDTDLVGIENHITEILEVLNLEGNCGKLSVISMVGMGGIGKTKLAWKVYENIEVKRHFFVRAWVCVSQFYSRRDLLRNMLLQFYKAAMESTHAEVSQMDEISLISEIRNLLEDKRYLVIFDDVWNPQVWNYVKNALPVNNTGSKVLLTTRVETVALTCRGSSDSNHIYKLTLLSREKAWELFCKKVFQRDYGGQCPQWLEEISHSIVEKCEGLPLALVTVGGLLSTKDKVLSEWKKFRDSLGSELEHNAQLSNVTKILLLSYNGLPNYLKPCVVYFGMFPESSSIEYNRLIRLWTAEDFVRRKRGITIEDVAKEYLLELIRRSLVQVSVWYDSGRPKAFRVHDLVHEILRLKLQELNFCQVLEKENRQVDVHNRRLSIQEGCWSDALKSITNKCTIHSVLLFGAQVSSSVSLSASLFKKVYLLKVLDLEGSPLEKIPNEIGDLSLLQYLSLRSTKATTIPRSIGNLQMLLTLDLKRCPMSKLPVEIYKLRKLRHLIIYQNTWDNTSKFWVIGGMKISKEGLGCFDSLQKLADVDVATSVGFMDQLSHFRELRYLAISNVKREDSKKLCKAIEKLNRLESLTIAVDYNSHDPLELQHVQTPPFQLERLYLIGPLDKFPEWIGKLDNLNKLRFRSSKLNDIRLEVLQGLPNLTMLGINKDAYSGQQLIFKEEGFKKLKFMYFDSLPDSVEIRQGALPLLEDLTIRRCPHLREVPRGLRYLENLTSFRVVEMPEEFVRHIKPGGSLHYIVHHVADIRVGYQSTTGEYILQKL